MAETTAGGAAQLEDVFSGASAMARLMRELDWSATDFDAPQRWPPNLRMAVNLCLASRFPTLLWWGPRLSVLYNDAYIAFLGPAKHPRMLGRPGKECWGEMWRSIGPTLEGVMRTGVAACSEDFELYCGGRLPLEEVYVTLTYAPILASDGSRVEGIFCPCFETTERVVGARRLETLRRLGMRATHARTVRAACADAAAVLRQNPRDLSFVAIYVGAGTEARYAAGVLPGHGHCLPPYILDAVDDARSSWPLAQVLRAKQAMEFFDLEASGVHIAGGEWPEPIGQALALPIQAAQGQIAGLLVVGAGARRPLDAAYRTFLELVAGQVGAAISDAQAHEAQRRQAAQLVERRQSEEKSRLSEERFRNYFNLGLIGGALTSPDKAIMEVNDELCRILGYERDELLEKSWAEVTHPDDLAADVALFERLLAGGIDGYSLDKRFLRKDGAVIDVIMAARAVRRADGSVDYLVGLVQDITARKRAEESLQRLQAELAHVARVSTMGEMASSIAHEINQPLAAIVANASACARWLGMDPANMQEASAAAARIARDARHASEVIARIRAFVQRRDIDRTPLDLAEVAREALGMAEAEIRRHGVSLSFSAAAQLPLIVGDRVHLQQVILNLLKNAVEAMTPLAERNKILAVTVCAHGADKVGVAVSDGGIGLHVEMRERIFDAFYTTKAGGMGMGLAISRSIIEAHGGRLWAGANEGPGAILQFALPAAAGGRIPAGLSKDREEAVPRAT
jgi:PAS domain S-box-containing protein